MIRFGRAGGRKRTRLFFATDVHGSERCFRKWLNAAAAYEVDALVLGGDVAGKTFAAIVEDPRGVYTAMLHGAQERASSDAELAELEQRIRIAGHYPLIVTPDQQARLTADKAVREQAMRTAMVEQLRRWTELADERLKVPAYAILGNDDPPELAEVLRQSERIGYGEDGPVELPGGYPMVSFGYSTPTPWSTPRELSEDVIADRVQELVAQIESPHLAVWNFHCPPHETHLDKAPMLDGDLRPILGPSGAETASVGSMAIRQAVLREQPLLGLHGHVHESAAMQRLGSTTCINPGSEYGQGILRGALVELEPERGVTTWQLMQG